MLSVPNICRQMLSKMFCFHSFLSSLHRTTIATKHEVRSTEKHFCLFVCLLLNYEHVLVQGEAFYFTARDQLLFQSQFMVVFVVLLTLLGSRY